MNCNTCRYQLSQCLDGRLPSGRRSVVMQHVESCTACSRFWRELQAAQQLTLRLQQPRVSDDFREGLWERIRAGEGTPEEVFRETTPTWTKVRYTLTGAAAAAAILFAAAWLGSDHTSQRRTTERAATEAGTRDEAPSVASATPPKTEPETVVFASSPLVSATQPLTFNLVAVEAARQLELRHSAVGAALRRIDDPSSNRESAMRQAFENADELRAFGELLLDLRDRRRLIFTESEVDADLRFAVKLLGQGRHLQRNRQALDSIVVPAMRSERLGTLSRTISLVPMIDPRAELDALARMNAQRPEEFRKLFIVLGDGHQIERDSGWVRGGAAFFMADPCGPSWVAPRSEVEARDGLLRMLRQSVDNVRITFEMRTHQPR